MANEVKFLYDQHLDNAGTTVRVYNTRNNNELIVKAFYMDDFHLSIANQWATGDATIVKSLVDAAGSMVTGRTGKLLTSATNWALNKINPETKEGQELKNKALKFVDTARRYQNSHIFSADDFYKTFKGSSVTFPLNLQVSLLSDEVYPQHDIYDKLKKILNVSIGDYDSYGGFIGIQHAPNGFKSGEFNLSSDVMLEGTLKVIYGDPDKGGYTLDNMVISNVHATFSKTKVEVRPNVFRPLYIDLQIMLEPGKKFTKVDIERNLGLPKGSLKRVAPNLKQRNGKSNKELSSDNVSRKRNLEETKNRRDDQIRNDSFNRIFGDTANYEFDKESGKMVFFGEYTIEEQTAILDKLSEVDKEKDFPGVKKFDLSLMETV